MLKRKVGIIVAAAALAAGLAGASALADTNPAPFTPVATPAVQGVDEQGTANDVADAADDVQTEANSTEADHQDGQQGADDESEEQGDHQDGQQGADDESEEQGDHQDGHQGADDEREEQGDHQDGQQGADDESEEQGDHQDGQQGADDESEDGQSGEDD